MKELLNTINNIKNNGILTPINIFTKKDENKIIKKILNSDKFKEIYPNTDKEKALSIIKCNFGLLASKEENNNYNHEFLVYDNGGSKEVFLYFEGSRARKWSLESEIIEVEETKTYKNIDNSIFQATTKENKINDLNYNKKELRPIFNADIKGHEEYQKEELKKYNSGALNFTHKRINNNMIDEYTKYFVYKDNTFMSVKPSKAGYTSGYYEHVRKYNYKVDHVNKIILFTDKEIEEVKLIKEEFYNNEVEPVEKNNNYISMTEEEHQELVKLSNIWSEKIPTDKEQGKQEFLHLLFKYQEQKKTKEELKKHINKLYAANKNIIEANKKKEGINNYLVDLLATEDILQQNNIIKNEFFKNAYNYIKSVS